MVEKILNNTTPYGKIRASHEGSLHSSTLKQLVEDGSVFSFPGLRIGFIVTCSQLVGKLPLIQTSINT